MSDIESAIERLRRVSERQFDVAVQQTAEIIVALGSLERILGDIRDGIDVLADQADQGYRAGRTKGEWDKQARRRARLRNELPTAPQRLAEGEDF